MTKIFFHSADLSFQYKQKKKLKSFIETIFFKEKKVAGSIRYIFCSDEYLLKINTAFLHHNYYTDIITFDLSDSAPVITGEIYISVDRVKENAKTIGVSYSDEILRVVFHGALHLCGYKDKEKKEVLVMRKKEDQYIEIFKQSF